MENSENNNQWKLESALSRFVILGKLLVIVTGLICGGRICAPFAGLFGISQTWLSFTLKLHELCVTKISFGFLQMNTPSFVRNQPSQLWPSGWSILMTKCLLDQPAYEWKVAPYSTLWRVALVKYDSILLYSLCFLRMNGPWVVNFQINTVWVHHRNQHKSWIFLSNPAQSQCLLQVHVCLTSGLEILSAQGSL